jgi:hypothetical protein
MLAHKLAACSSTCVFIGYPVDHRGYTCYKIARGRVITSQHIIFDETVFSFCDNIRVVLANLNAITKGRHKV